MLAFIFLVFQKKTFLKVQHLQMLDHIPCEPILGPDDDLNDLVELVGLQAKGLQDPGKVSLAVVRGHHNLE